MTRRFSLLISWGCALLLVGIPVIAMYFLINIDSFAAFTRNSIGLPIQWNTVANWQWYALWLITMLYLSIGLVGLYYLRRPFANFANGELFNPANSRDLHRFALLLFAQAIAKPVHFAACSMLLSVNHSAGNKMLSISLGSNEIKMVAVAIVIWVMSRLLIEGSKLQSENRQFV